MEAVENDEIQWQTVSRTKFYRFIEKYPNPLVRNVAIVYTPALISYNDLSTGKMWPHSVVATCDGHYAVDGSLYEDEFQIIVNGKK